MFGPEIKAFVTLSVMRLCDHFPGMVPLQIKVHALILGCNNPTPCNGTGSLRLSSEMQSGAGNPRPQNFFSGSVHVSYTSSGVWSVCTHMVAELQIPVSFSELHVHKITSQHIRFQIGQVR
jgi:hypothetical protein